MRKSKELKAQEALAKERKAREQFEYGTKFHCKCVKDAQKEFFEESLRDQMAMAAMNGMLAATSGSLDPRRNKNWANNIAKHAYKVADAMLKARSENDDSADD